MSDVDTAAESPVQSPSKTETTTKAQPEKGVGSRRHAFFMVLTSIVLAICVPYIFYSVKLYYYIRENAAIYAPEGFRCPEVTDFALSVVSAVVFELVYRGFRKAAGPLVRAA